MLIVAAAKREEGGWVGRLARGVSRVRQDVAYVWKEKMGSGKWTRNAFTGCVEKASDPNKKRAYHSKPVKKVGSPRLRRRSAYGADPIQWPHYLSTIPSILTSSSAGTRLARHRIHLGNSRRKLEHELILEPPATHSPTFT